MLRTETSSGLPAAARAEVLELVERVTRARGASPLDEHKQRQLQDDDGSWTAVLAHDDGRLVGYAHLRWGRAGAAPRATTELVVAEGGDRVAQPLLAAVEAAVAEAGGGTLFAWAHAVDDPAATPAARRGYALQRVLAQMARPLDEPPPAPVWPPGVTLRRYRPGPDDDELLRVNNAAFAGHPEQGGWDRDDLAARREAAWFDPDDVLLAVADGRLLGFHWTKRTVDDDGAALGEVYVLGLDPEAQGRGLGRALLRAGLQHLRARGCRRVVLYVDLAQTAAVGLYRSEGFAVARREVCYEHEVAPSTAGATAAATPRGDESV